MKTMKKCLLLIITVIFIIQGTAQTKYVSNTRLNVRSQPIINQDNIISKLKYGDEVSIISIDKDWAFISVSDIKGYSYYPYLSKRISNKDKIQSVEDINSEQKSTSNQNEIYVLICRGTSAYAYHSHYCQGLNRCQAAVEKVTLTYAKQIGRTPCGYCY
jgi:uncharacterized protein YgiM (DUF1202 family)